MSTYVKDITFSLLCGHKDCQYAVNLVSKRTYCNYMEIEGHSRPCKPTKDCKCYKKGEMVKVVHQLHIEKH